MIQGLDTVARNHHEAEQANVVGPSMGPASPGGVSTPSNGDPRLFDVAAMGFAFSLAAENLAVATMLGIAATMAPLAMAGLTTWAAFAPNDALNTASGRLDSAAQALEQVPNASHQG